MPRFVLLYHACPRGYERPSHWDLMFEAGGVLRTWALGRLPPSWQEGKPSPFVVDELIAAEELPDHRLAYLEFEGPVAGGRGEVRRVDEGTYETVAQSDACWTLTLTGKRCRGTIALCRGVIGDRHWTLAIESPSAAADI